MRAPWSVPAPVRVELALNPYVESPAWRDVTGAVKGDPGVTVSRGRPSRWEPAQPPTCSLVLDNTDGAFSDVAGESGVLFGRRVRVTVRDWARSGNVAPNPGFEVASTSEWSGVFGTPGTGTLSMSTVRSVAPSGRSMLVTWGTQPGASAVQCPVDTVIGRAYEATMLVWVPAGSPAVQLNAHFVTSGPTSTVTGAWQVLRVRWTATWPLSYPGLRTTGTTAGQSVHVGAIRVDELDPTAPARPAVEPFTTLAAAGWTATPLTGGVGSPVWPRFTGRVTSSATTWPGAHRAVSPVTAVGRMARLSAGAQTFHCPGTEETIASGPFGYWPLNELAETTGAGSRAGSTQPPMRSTASGSWPVFGQTQATATCEHTGATFTADDHHLQARLARSLAWLEGAVTLSAVIRTLAVGAAPNVYGSGSLIVSLGDRYGVAYSLALTTAGRAAARRTDIWTGASTEVEWSTAINDGTPHHLALVATQTSGAVTLRLYVDGVERASTSGLPQFGAYDVVQVGTMSGRPAASGTISHVAVWPRALTEAEMVDLAAGHRTGWDGEPTNYRLARYARWAGVPTGDLSLDGDSLYAGTMGHVATDGMSPWEALTLCDGVEGGALSEDGAGRVRFRGRRSGYDPTPTVTIPGPASPGGGLLRDTLQYGVDGTGLVNDMQAARPGGATQRVVDSVSIEEHGVHSETVTIHAADDDQVSDILEWRVSTGSTPKPRASGVSVRLTRADDATTDALLDVEVGSKVALTGLPSQAPAATDLVAVDGVTETYSHTDGAVWTVETTPVVPVWIVEHPVYGVLDGAPVVAY